MIRPDRDEPIHDLFPSESADFVTPESETDGRATLARLNRLHQRTRPGDPRLEARIVLRAALDRLPNLRLAGAR